MDTCALPSACLPANSSRRISGLFQQRIFCCQHPKQVAGTGVCLPECDALMIINLITGRINTIGINPHITVPDIGQQSPARLSGKNDKIIQPFPVTEIFFMQRHRILRLHMDCSSKQS